MKIKENSLLNNYFKDYEYYHQHKVNKILHYIGVPLIMWSILGMLAKIHFGIIDLGFIFWFGVTVWYFWLHKLLAIFFSIFTFIVYVSSLFISIPWLLGAFILGWILQLIGHIYFEKKSPAFTKNFIQLFIGPLWLFFKTLKNLIPIGSNGTKGE